MMDAARLSHSPMLVVRGLLLASLAGCVSPYSMQPSEPPAPPARSAAVAVPVPTTTAPPAVAPAPPAVAAPAPAAAAAPAPAAPPPTPLPFDDAVANAANALFGKAALPPDAPPRLPLVIDPLVDGVTGIQSAATRSMGERIVEIVRNRYPRFEVQPFSSAALATRPLVLIGTFTPVNNAGTAGAPRDAYRICLALADFRSGRILSKGVARASFDGVDSTPTAYFNDSPAWTRDRAVEGYIRTCQGTKPGDPIDAVYADRIVAAALLADAIDAYDARRYREALELYRSALQTPGGDQLRAYNGVYLANWKLGRRDEAAQAFARIVDYGLENDRLAVKFLFQPGSTQFVTQSAVSSEYPLWISQLARRAAERSACMEIVGHSSPTGPEPVNERLSLLRAQFIKSRLDAAAPALARRTITNGVGSRENLVGTGRDDASDALDRRVEFKVIGC